MAMAMATLAPMENWIYKYGTASRFIFCSLTAPSDRSTHVPTQAGEEDFFQLTVTISRVLSALADGYLLLFSLLVPAYLHRLL